MTSSPDPSPSSAPPSSGAAVAGTEPACSPAGAAHNRRVPDFIIVGHQKCGTTAMYLMLRDHPQIFLPEVKEPRFFASDLRSRLEARAPSRMHTHTLEAYLQLFVEARADQRAGDASPQYLRSVEAAKGIAAMQPDARIIAILREPASYLRSFHLQMVSSGVETQKDFKRALALEPARRQGKRIPRRCHHPEALLYSDHVRYVEQLQRFREVFPSEQVLVLIYEDFRRDNEATVRQVLRFLEVDDTHEISSIATNRVNAVRSLPLHQLRSAGRRGRRNPDAASRFDRLVSALTPELLRSDAFRRRWRRLAYSAPPQPDEAFMLELRRRFMPEVQTLGDYLGRDLLSAWGYDSLV
jgi:ribosomal protein L39E